MESLLTKKFTVPPVIVAIGKGVGHAGIVWILGAILMFPFLFLMWSVDDVLIILIMSGVYVGALYMATYLLRDKLLKLYTQTSILASSFSMALVIAFTVFNIVRAENYLYLQGNIIFLLALLMLPIVNYLGMKYLLKQFKFS
jgi:hypothetical protein